ncbi:hypothetical protein GCM10009665_21070 [Kitasatospora nipponensis]|uniref:Secreted protein with PEP-CTERM sorting signal n=1 Tax=Kitasatospora nipponensis TaxID=258049 RepID=A0ABP4GMJ7_9ACTN
MDLVTLVREGATLAGATGVIYTATIAGVAAFSIFARSPQRRRDARKTLSLLLRRPDNS